MILDKLNFQIILHIFDFLTVEEIYSKYARIDKTCYRTAHHHTIIKIITKMKFGDGIIHHIPCDTKNLISLIKLLRSNLLKELPFLGFKSDTNAIMKDQKYWIDKFFTAHRHYTCHSGYPNFDLKLSATNLHIEGMISIFMNNFMNLSLAHFKIKNNSIDDITIFSKYYKKFCKTYDFESEYLAKKKEFFFEYPEYKEAFQEIIHKLKTKRSHLDKQLYKFAASKVIETSCDPIPGCVGIIKGFEVNRGLKRSTSNVTCPVQTLMLYTSFQKISFASEIVKMFNDVKSESEFINIYLSNKDNLPHIYETNVSALSKYAKHKIDMNKYHRIKLVIFKNEDNKISHEVKPIAWIHFEDQEDYHEEFNEERNILENKCNYMLSKENYFGGIFSLVKLINSYKIRTHNSSFSNIDIHYCRLFGDLFIIE